MNRKIMKILLHSPGLNVKCHLKQRSSILFYNSVIKTMVQLMKTFCKSVIFVEF